MMKRTISGMTGTGSLAHNRRDFIAENVNQNRVYLNICYRDENLKDVYKELFDESVERYNVGKRNDRKITNYYDKIQHGKQEKLFHEVIFQIGNNKDMAAGTPEGDLAVKVLDEYMQDFQRRNPTLRVFCCYLHQDEATPHLHTLAHDYKIAVNDKRVLRICRKKKIQSYIKHRYNCCTKPASDPAYVAENILNREFKSDMM